MKLGIIGGSGLYALDGLQRVESRQAMTAWGAPSGTIVRGWLGTTELLFLPRHGPQHHLPPHLINYRANIAALADLGVRTILATAAVGGIEPAATTGTLVIPHDLIDYTSAREHTYSDGSQPHPHHVDFTAAYAREARQLLIAGATRAGLSVRAHGIYAATQGPRLETAAEIDRLERDGCTVVGMTGMPEAALARELGIAYANISLVVNPAAGRAHGPITLAAIEAALAAGMVRVREIIAAAARLAALQ
jgi:5'-methylthioinosine phosphorylase